MITKTTEIKRTDKGCKEWVVMTIRIFGIPVYRRWGIII